jgi:hypothetical protein
MEAEGRGSLEIEYNELKMTNGSLELDDEKWNVRNGI